MPILIHLTRAFLYSMKGLAAAYASERSFRIEVWASTVLLPLALVMGETGVEKALLLMSWLLVLIAELANTAIEAVVDRISAENHPLSGKAKDIGSAMVLLALALCSGVWLLLLL